MDILGQRISTLLSQRKTADFIFVVGKGNDQREIPVHRDILSVWSQTLMDLLFGLATPGCVGTLAIEDKDPDAFEEFVKYLYTGRVELHKGNVGALLDLSTDYSVQSLQDACHAFLDDELEPDNVIDLLMVARRFKNKKLEDKYLAYIYTCAAEVVKTAGWLRLPEEQLLAFVASDNLAASEADIFESLVRWSRFDAAAHDRRVRQARRERQAEQRRAAAEAKLEDPDMPPVAHEREEAEEADCGAAEGEGADLIGREPNKEEKDRASRLPELLKRVRWGRMSLKEIMKVVRPTGLLPEHQLAKFVEYIADPAKAPADEFNSTPREPPAVYRPATDNFQDNTGIIWYIGTDEGRSAYRNPVPARLGVTMSSSAGASQNSIADRNVRSGAVENSYGRERNPWIALDFKGARVRVEKYFIAQEHDHYLRNWRLEGSDDGMTWVTLRDHVNDATLTSSHRTHVFDVNAPRFWKRLRLYVTGPSHNNANNFDITQLEFYGWVSMPYRYRG